MASCPHVWVEALSITGDALTEAPGPPALSAAGKKNKRLEGSCSGATPLTRCPARCLVAAGPDWWLSEPARPPPGRGPPFSIRSRQARAPGAPGLPVFTPQRIRREQSCRFNGCPCAESPWWWPSQNSCSSRAHEPPWACWIRHGSAAASAWRGAAPIQWEPAPEGDAETGVGIMPWRGA